MPRLEGLKDKKVSPVPPPHHRSRISEDDQEQTLVLRQGIRSLLAVKEGVMEWI